MTTSKGLLPSVEKQPALYFFFNAIENIVTATLYTTDDSSVRDDCVRYNEIVT